MLPREQQIGSLTMTRWWLRAIWITRQMFWHLPKSLRVENKMRETSSPSSRSQALPNRGSPKQIGMDHRRSYGTNRSATDLQQVIVSQMPTTCLKFETPWTRLATWSKPTLDNPDWISTRTQYMVSVLCSDWYFEWWYRRLQPPGMYKTCHQKKVELPSLSSDERFGTVTSTFNPENKHGTWLKMMVSKMDISFPAQW